MEAFVGSPVTWGYSTSASLMAPEAAEGGGECRGSTSYNEALGFFVVKSQSNKEPG